VATEKLKKKKSIFDRFDASKSMKKAGVANVSGMKYTGDVAGLFAVMEQQSFSPINSKFSPLAPQVYVQKGYKKGYQPYAGSNALKETKKRNK